MAFGNWIDSTQARMFSSKLPIFQQDVESKPAPAPVKGWDAISPLSNMPTDYGVIVDNAVPRPGWVEIRGGYNAWAQGLGEIVESLMVYRPTGAAQTLFAVSDGAIWDVSDYGSPVGSLGGLQANRWQYINFTPAGGITHLVAVDGTDPGLIYNGSWDLLDVTGVPTTNLINVTVHKRRIWFVEKNSTNAWYLATDAIAGPATMFELGSLFTKGGFLLAAGSWTIDGGAGPDDYLGFVSSEGQIALYKGVDPGSADTWLLVGVFNLPNPIGNRCLRSMGSDLLIVTLEGLLPLSKALPFDPSGVRSVSLTNRIQNAMLEAVGFGRDIFGWEVTLFPLKSLLLMNVPVSNQEVYNQFVMNTLTGAWCQFTGWNALCFEIFNNSLYFGDINGNVNLAYAGGLDLVSPISMDIKCAFNYFDDPGRNKIIQMARPFMVSDGSITPFIGVDVDFAEGGDLEAPVSTLTPVGGIWDEAIWDESTWAASRSASVDWLTVVGIGTALALRMKVNLAVGGSASSVIVMNSIFDTGTFDNAIFDGNGVTTASGAGIPILQINQFEVVLEHGAPV